MLKHVKGQQMVLLWSITKAQFPTSAELSQVVEVDQETRGLRTNDIKRRAGEARAKTVQANAI